jgi:hypothetical protein
VKVYGGTVEVPIFFVPLRNATLVMASSADVAVAERRRVAGAISIGPFLGAAESVTVGAGSCVTVIATAEDVAEAPKASFATAVME